jgi:hypothetical protein
MRAAGVQIARVGFDEHGRPIIVATSGMAIEGGEASLVPQDEVEL